MVALVPLCHLSSQQRVILGHVALCQGIAREWDNTRHPVMTKTHTKKITYHKLMHVQSQRTTVHGFLCILAID